MRTKYGQKELDLLPKNNQLEIAINNILAKSTVIRLCKVWNPNNFPNSNKTHTEKEKESKRKREVMNGVWNIRMEKTWRKLCERTNEPRTNKENVERKMLHHNNQAKIYSMNE